MPYRDEIFPGAGYYRITTSDEWERIKAAAMQRARDERAQVAADIGSWIVRTLRRGGRSTAIGVRKFCAETVRRANASSLIAANR